MALSVKTKKVLEKAEELLDAMENRWTINSSGQASFWDEEIENQPHFESFWFTQYNGKKGMVSKFFKAYDTLGIKNPPESINTLRQWNEIVWGVLPKKQQVLPIVRNIIESLKQEETSVTKNRQKEIDQENMIQQEGGFNITYLSKLSKPELDKFEEVLKKSIAYIKNSPVKDFKEVLYGDLYVGRAIDFKEILGVKYAPRNALAFYSITDKNIKFYTQYLNEPGVIGTVIHEFGHKFDYEVHNKSDELLELLQKWSCRYEEPKIGFVLKKDTLIPSWLVSSQSSLTTKQDYVLEKIQYISRKKAFLFRGVQDNHEMLLLENDLKSIQSFKYCSSGYGSTNYDEWFAEMITAITLGLVRPSYKEVADEFLAILNDETIKTSNIKLRLAKLKNLK
jgi:hypothetical protein